MTGAARALHVKNLSVAYGRRLVVREVSLAPIPFGTLVALVGPNGAGKSTLLRALAGFLPAQGQALLGGAELLQATPVERAKLVGFMPQALPVGAGLTVLDSVVSALRSSPFDETVDGRSPVEKAATVLNALNVAHLGLQPLDSLSGGQKQVVALAQALARDPTLVLLDEPTSALDLNHQFQIMSCIHGVAKSDRVVLVVLHDLALAARWADRIVVLRNGAIDSDGAADDVVTEAMLERVYGVSARIERCSRGRPHVLVDGLAPQS